MNVGATPAPHFADFVAAAAARRAAGDRPSPALRLAEPLPLVSVSVAPSEVELSVVAPWVSVSGTP